MRQEFNKIVAPETLKLERLLLRRPKLTDAEAIFQYGSDPEVARYADWPVRKDIESLIESLRERPARWESGSEFTWVITLANEDRAIGGITCIVANDAAEVGFLLNRRHWGKGFATEAAKAIVDWALSLPAVSKVWATCDAENLASACVLEKIGLSRECGSKLVVRPNISSEPRAALTYSRTRTVA